MNRRTLLQRFAAIAAAVAVAPAVETVQAAPDVTPKTHVHVERDGCPPSIDPSAAVIRIPRIGNLHVDPSRVRQNSGVHISGESGWEYSTAYIGALAHVRADAAYRAERNRVSFANLVDRSYEKEIRDLS